MIIAFINVYWLSVWNRYFTTSQRGLKLRYKPRAELEQEIGITLNKSSHCFVSRRLRTVAWSFVISWRLLFVIWWSLMVRTLVAFWCLGFVSIGVVARLRIGFRGLSVVCRFGVVSWGWSVVTWLGIRFWSFRVVRCCCGVVIRSRIVFRCFLVAVWTIRYWCSVIRFLRCGLIRSWWIAVFHRSSDGRSKHQESYGQQRKNFQICFWNGHNNNAININTNKSISHNTEIFNVKLSYPF